MYQSVAVLGLGLVACGEELSAELAGRMADHLLQYGDTSVRRMVPLALALCHVSDPVYEIVDVLSKLSHDPNEDTSQTAIFAMGLVGAGTNNSRIAGLLRTLATFYRNEANHLFIVRLAQGMLHMGKVSGRAG
jgi:26S proteasome regulatory subunit N1